MATRTPAPRYGRRGSPQTRYPLSSLSEGGWSVPVSLPISSGPPARAAPHDGPVAFLASDGPSSRINGFALSGRINAACFAASRPLFCPVRSRSCRSFPAKRSSRPRFTGRCSPRLFPRQTDGNVGRVTTLENNLYLFHPKRHPAPQPTREKPESVDNFL